MWRSATASVPRTWPGSQSGPTRLDQLLDRMRVLTVRHCTRYRYSEPVGFGEHRMMFRPRESHDLRLLSPRLEITPRASELRWLHDVFDNSVAIANFDTTEIG